MAADYHKVHPDFRGARENLERRLIRQLEEHDMWAGRRIDIYGDGEEVSLLSVPMHDIREYARKLALAKAQQRTAHFERSGEEIAKIARGEAA